MWYLIFDTLFLPVDPTVQILIDFQLHLLLLFLDNHLLPLFHGLDDIFRNSTIFEPIIDLIKFHSIFMNFFLFSQFCNQFLSSSLFLFIISSLCFLHICKDTFCKWIWSSRDFKSWFKEFIFSLISGLLGSFFSCFFICLAVSLTWTPPPTINS